METILEKTYKAALKFLVPLTPEETYAKIVAEAITLAKAEYGSILLEDNGALVRVYSSSPELYNFQVRQRGITYTVYKTNKPKIISKDQLVKHHPEIKAMDARSNIVIPLSYENKSVGVISIWSKKARYFTAKDLNILKFFGPLATMAIRKTQLYDETRKALETRDLFISMASHELKTPLTTVYTYMQLMELKVSRGEQLDIDWVTTVANEVTRLSKLIKELLQVEQIKTGDLHYSFKRCNIMEIMSRTVRDFKVTHPNSNIIFDNQLVKKRETVYGDYDKIIQVIFNLLTNAIKFSTHTSPVVARLEKYDGEVVISIIDNGQGIAKKDLPNIFEGFYRGRNGLHEGMGLGLYLTKQIIDKHDGTIHIKSRLHKGTTVCVRLPVY